MKFVIGAILALAIRAEALYPLPQPIVPAATYGVPEESKTEIPPVKTEYSYTVASVPVSAPVPTIEVHHEEPHVDLTPVQAVVPVQSIQPKVYVPTLSTFVAGHIFPDPKPNQHSSSLLNQGLRYGTPVPSTQIYGPSSISSYGYVLPHNYGYSVEQSLLPYSYAYSASHVAVPLQGVYGSSPVHVLASGVHEVVPTLPAAEVVTVAGPAPISTVVTESHHVPEVVHQVVPQVPVVSNYEYNLPQVVVPDVPQHVVPQTVYGVPEISKPVAPHTTYGVPLLH